MFKKGFFRQKTGIIKEHVQMKFYHDSENIEPKDVVDHYLFDKYNIVLNTDEDRDKDVSLSSQSDKDKRKNG